MRAGTYPARHLATLRGSELGPGPRGNRVEWLRGIAEFTPGLQRRFAGLDPGFTDRQWPGFGPRSHPYGLAGTYVFIKQSGPPCHCDLRTQRCDLQVRRHSFSRSYGANLPSSLARVIPQTPWATHPGAPVSVLGTGAGDRISPPPFQGPPGSAEGPNGPHSRLQPLLTITVLQGLHRLAGSRLFSRPRSAYPEASEARLALPRLPPRHGNINPFPFPRVRVTARVRAG